MMEILHTRKSSLPNFGSFHNNIDYVLQRRNSHYHIPNRPESISGLWKSRKTSAPGILEDIFYPGSRNISINSDIQSVGSSHSRRGSITAYSNLDDDAILVECSNPSDLHSCPYLVFSHHLQVFAEGKVYKSDDISERNYFTLYVPIDPRTHHIIEVYQLNDKRILMVIENYWTKCTELYLDTIKNILRLVHSKTPYITLNTQCHFTALNQMKGILALYDAIGSELSIVSYVDASKHPISSISLKPFMARYQMKIRNLLFILGTDELCFVKSSGSFKIFDLSRRSFRT
ncbi:hypothetical protein K7432_006376 [Basidiobolus ranarum]|uniref:Uncharacterized protein n=1 Tax=Basidiobolus ranarum TaxID=34480 RepID=A0ABR2WV66_9FUNG